jgi:hypothetical protein
MGLKVLLKFVRRAVELICVSKVWLDIRKAGLSRTFGFANAAIDALVWVNDEHILSLIEAIDGTYLHAIHIFAPNAVVGNDEGHDALFGQGRSGR